MRDYLGGYGVDRVRAGCVGAGCVGAGSIRDMLLYWDQNKPAPAPTEIKITRPANTKIKTNPPTLTFAIA